MSLGEHELFLDSLRNIEVWLSFSQRTLDALGELRQKSALSPVQRYEIDSFYWCLTCVGLYNRLVRIRDMTGRSIHLRKGEEKGSFTKDWLIYNYQFYIVIYQSALDVALLLVNAILDLGINDRKCTFDTICENRKVKESNLHLILKTLNKMTNEHREGKNLLLHRGKGVRTPNQFVNSNVFDIADLAKGVGIEETQVITYIEHFLAIRNQNDLVLKMDDEIGLLEQCILRLFNTLLPIYKSNHSLYSDRRNII